MSHTSSQPTIISAFLPPTFLRLFTRLIRTVAAISTAGTPMLAFRGWSQGTPNTGALPVEITPSAGHSSLLLLQFTFTRRIQNTVLS